MTESDNSSHSAQAEFKPSACAEFNHSAQAESSHTLAQTPVEIDILVGVVDCVVTDAGPVVHAEKIPSRDDFWFDFEQVKIPESIPGLADKDASLISDFDFVLNASNALKSGESVENGKGPLPFLCVEDDMSHFKVFAPALGRPDGSSDSTAVFGELRSELPLFSSPYQLIVLGRTNDREKSNKQDIFLEIDERLLLRLSCIASGSRSMLVELALVHMIKSLESARQGGESVVVIDAKDVKSALDF